MAAEMQRELGVKAELIPSGGGVFEVTVDGKLLFSKKALERFPDEGEILEKIRSR